jgi:hypothetical protein
LRILILSDAMNTATCGLGSKTAGGGGAAAITGCSVALGSIPESSNPGQTEIATNLAWTVVSIRACFPSSAGSAFAVPGVATTAGTNVSATTLEIGSTASWRPVAETISLFASVRSRSMESRNVEA